MKIRTLFVGAIITMMIAVIVVGCSKDAPLQPSTTNLVSSARSAALSQTQFAAQIQSRVEAQRMLTFLGRPDTVIANQNCEITRLQQGQEMPASFGEVQVGDSVQVFGEQNQYGYVYAYKLRIRWQSQDSCQLISRVATMDRDRLRLTLRDCSDTVLFDQNCACVRQTKQLEIRSQLGELKVGDSVHITGSRGPNGYVYAHHFRICTSDPTGRWDIAFKDTIATINYAEGTFTVVNRPELIVTDANTVIRGILTRITPEGNNQNRMVDASAAGPYQWGQTFVDTLLLFTDLEESDVVQIHAVYLDSTTLLATCITLVNCAQVEQKKCVEFTDTIREINYASRSVTFSTASWIGTVCNGALLTSPDGAPLTLMDFLAGDRVAVKGFPVTEDSLRICVMTKVAND